MATTVQIPNFISGEWRWPKGTESLKVKDPGTGRVIAEVGITSGDEFDRAVQTAIEQSRHWRAVPVTERIQFLFKFKNLLEDNFAELSRTITAECGKTAAEADGEIRRGIENVETACGAPSLLQGYNNQDIARGIDEHMFRQP